MKEEFKILKAFLKETLFKSSVTLLCFFLCILVFKLYHIDAEAISYSCVLCIFIFVVKKSIEYYLYLKAFYERQRLFHSIEYNINDISPAKSRLEEDYRELLLNLLKEKREEVEKKEEDYQEIKNYIMLWGHQIKTPITGMKLLLQNAELEFVEDEKMMKHLHRMKEELFEIEYYVGMNLEYIRLDSLNADLSIKECDLKKIIHTEVKHFSQMFIAKKLYIKMENLDKKIITDEKWIAFVIGQILSNSIKYTKKGGIKIWAQDEKENIVIYIEDTGIGIEKEDIPRLFEKAFTGYNGHVEKQSTGIGLYLTKKILEKMGHTIEITSEVGKGTCVKIAISNIRYE